jgi:hypothetical protein
MNYIPRSSGCIARQRDGNMNRSRIELRNFRRRRAICLVTAPAEDPMILSLVPAHASPRLAAMAKFWCGRQQLDQRPGYPCLTICATQQSARKLALRSRGFVSLAAVGFKAVSAPIALRASDPTACSGSFMFRRPVATLKGDEQISSSLWTSGLFGWRQLAKMRAGPRTIVTEVRLRDWFAHVWAS